MGFEPMTSSLPRKCSTPELQQRDEKSDLERVEGIEPSPPAWKAGALPLSYTRVHLSNNDPRDGQLATSQTDRCRSGGLGGAGFEPAKA